MIDVWLIGHTFDGWDNWKEQVQFNLLAKAFLNLGCEVKFVTLDKLKIYDNSRLISYDDEVLEAPDIVILKTYIHTDFWKRKLLRLQTLGSLIINEPTKAIDYDNKINIYQKASESDIPIPKTLFMPYSHCDNTTLAEIDEKIGWPCIIKPNLGWGAIGLTTVESKNMMNESIKKSHKHYKENFGNYGINPSHFIIQEMIEAEAMVTAVYTGKSIHTTIYHGKGTHLTKTTYKNHELRESYLKNHLVVPFNPPSDLVELILKIKNSYDLTIFKAEFFITKFGFILCEINMTCGFTVGTLIGRNNMAAEIAEYALELYRTSVK